MTNKHRPQRHLGVSFTIIVTLSTALAPQANAASDRASSSFTLKGEAKPVCVMPAPRAAGSGVTYNEGVIIFDEFLQPDLTLNAGTVTITFPATMCNYNTMLSLTTASGAMRNRDPAATVAGDANSFLTEVDYTASLTWGSVSMPVLDTSQLGAGAAVEKIVGGANVGDLTLTIKTEGGTVPVVRGLYDDVITLDIGPAH